MMIGVERRRENNPFTEKQWEELENQVLTFRYLMSGVAVPPGLMSSVIKTSSNSTSFSTSTLFPQLQPILPFGLGSFQVGYGYGRKVDMEPGRCKRTDGKKWRCAKEAHPDSKYCEKHMRKGKSKAKKQSDALNNTPTKTVTNINPATTSAASRSYLPYPAVSYSHASQSNYSNKYQGDSTTTNFYSMVSAQSSSNGGMSTRDSSPSASSHWLGLDGGLHDQSDKQEIRYANEMFSEASKATSTTVKFHEIEHRNYKTVDEEEQHDDGEKLRNDKEHDTQKLYHHFLGDWPSNLKTTPAVQLFSTNN